MTSNSEPHTILGVPGTLNRVRSPSNAALFTNQEWKAGRTFGKDEYIRVNIRFDTLSGKNKQNDFSITGSTRHSCGCIHELIAEHFPELKPLIKWHLFDTHFVANTLYHASDRDHWGLRKGEKRQIINGKTKLPAWHLVAADEAGKEIELHRLNKQIDAETTPAFTPTLKWAPWCHVGEGKERQLNYARSTAVWPEATDQELIEATKESLGSRLVMLTGKFHTLMKEIGLAP